MTAGARLAAVPGRDEAVVAVAYGGICGSDLHYWKEGRIGESVLRSPMVLGHEVVGIVAEPAANGSGPALGSRVAVHPARVCGACGLCRRGAEHLCADLRYLGSAARIPHTDGGFAERLVLPARRLVPVPDALDMKTAALAEPASVALHGLDRVRELNRSVEGSDVLVIGSGPIGLLSVAMACALGAATITATDVFDHPLRLAVRIGATHVVRVDAEAPVPVPVPSADIAIESSGTPQGLATALRSLRSGGVLVNVGHLPPIGVTAPLHLVVPRELTLMGSSRFYHEMPAALEIMGRNIERFAPIVTSVFPLDDAESAFHEAAAAERSSKVLLSFPAAATS
ncbi:alcohol dehydrogenase catalytic domain-containing protein [Actinacidiphila yanglinensis]|uniref:alcohol dehydrogenase catalytic domain-containing protein n=1 Tax=Actinacidiphila yanglinensis TaxID=310779 RepID=UPI003899150B